MKSILTHGLDGLGVSLFEYVAFICDAPGEACFTKFGFIKNGIVFINRQRGALFCLFLEAETRHQELDEPYRVYIRRKGSEGGHSPYYRNTFALRRKKIRQAELNERGKYSTGK